MRRRIARRLKLARWAGLGIVASVAIWMYLGRLSEWFVYLGAALFLISTIVILVGEGQRCPLCDASLVFIKDRREQFATECPECGFVID